jgi:RNA polymerase sigma-70 factor (ECF subfamily)
MASDEERLYERVLVLRCQAGDAAAFEELFELYAPRLRYYIAKMLGGTPGTDDAVQDVWLEVLRQIGRLEAPGALSAWLYRIARDRVFRELRRLQREPQRLLDEEVAVANGQLDDFSAEDAAQVHKALDTLATEQREVLVLRFLEEMTYEEIARVIGCPIGTVRSRIHYAKSALRRALERKTIHE